MSQLNMDMEYTQKSQLINVIKDLVHAGLGTHPKTRESVKTYFAIVDFLDGLVDAPVGAPKDEPKADA